MTRLDYYCASLDGGEGGETTIFALSLRDAMKKALAWAADGDWSVAQEGTEELYGGCVDVRVRVWRADDDGEIVEEEEATYTIPTLGDLCEQEIDDDGEVLAEREHEYSTERLVRVGEDIYHQHENGGARGAWDRQGGDGVWRERPVSPTAVLSIVEARRLLLDWGYEPAEVARMTKEMG